MSIKGFTCFRCENVAVFRAEWSDREAYTCLEHREEVRWCHDNDHTYDALGIRWEGREGTLEFERRADLPYKGVELCV